jgi:hypothetical protein
LRLSRLIPRADDRAMPGIHIWLRRWFTSLAILWASVIGLIVVPFRDPYADGWTSIFQLPQLSGDVRVTLFGEALAYYMSFFLFIFLWHLLDWRYLTMRPVTLPRWDRLGYRVMTLGLIAAALAQATFRSRLFEYVIYDDTIYGFDGPPAYEPLWLQGLWYAALVAIGGGIVERAARAIARRATAPA